MMAAPCPFQPRVYRDNCATGSPKLHRSTGAACRCRRGYDSTAEPPKMQRIAVATTTTVLKVAAQWERIGDKRPHMLFRHGCLRALRSVTKQERGTFQCHEWHWAEFAEPRHRGR
uniref:Uncharacterized protein n=1 Tax=Arundo donax TaxID=35708 RepID=A0A0A8ZKS1_ARUDO